MNKRLREIRDNETPFKVIDIGDWNINLYWTPTRGVYGHQVVTIGYNYPEVITDKTNGCGYCKESEATTNVFRSIGLCPKSDVDTLKRYCISKISSEYWIGGNYYKVPKKDIRKVK